MEQTNAIINLAPSRLNFPLAPIYPRRGHSFVFDLRDAPADVTRLFVRIFRPNGAYFDVPANWHEDGRYTAYAIGTCFPDIGCCRYEIHASDYRGNPTALGEGIVTISDFSTTASPAETGEPVQVAQIPARGGGFVNVFMVCDEYGQWVYEAERVEDQT